MDKAISATKIIKYALRFANININIFLKGNKKYLEEKKLTKEQIVFGLKLAACIEFLDKMLFYNDNKIDIIFDAEGYVNSILKKPTKAIASYVTYGKNEKYIVFVENIPKELLIFKDIVVNSIDNDTNKIEQKKILAKTYKEYLNIYIISIAIHEIRHRFQNKFNIIFFNNKINTYINDKIYNKYKFLLVLTIESIKNYLYDLNKEYEEIKKDELYYYINNKEEIDAVFIQNLAINYFYKHNKISINQIIEILSIK